MSSAVLKVTKRRGYQENYNERKIRDCVQFACEGLDVDVETLFSLFDATLYDGIPTSEIQANLIHHAKTLCSPSAPDWTIVAGRLETMNRWAKTRTYGVPFSEFVHEQIEMGIWKHESFAKYTVDEMEEIGGMIVQDRDLNHSYASVIVAEQKYLLPAECIQHAFMGNAMIIASVEKRENRLRAVKEIYDDLSLRELSSATPWLSNLRSGGNISSCFIIDMTDDIDSIFQNAWYAALISKSGGGLGVHLGRLRARGSDLMGSNGKAGGIIGWNKIYSDIATFVNQGGKRAGAFTIALPIWHNDIEEFLMCQSEHGDPRTKAWGIQPQVGVHDLFMELKGHRGDHNKNVWHTFCPHEVESKLGLRIYEAWGDEFRDIYAKCVAAKEAGILKVSRTYQAKELFKLVMKRQFETGLPYIAFLDAINEANPNKHEGFIPCVNLCTESFSVVVPNKYAHTCNLMSIVVGRVGVDGLERAAARCTRILDNGIELTNSPNPLSSAHNLRYRTIGIGIQGLHDLLALEFRSYSDTRFISEVAERIAYGAIMESIRLAKERGAYPAFKGSDWDNGAMIARFKKHSVVGYDWDEVQRLIDIHGIRNSQLFSPAPNTSTSIFMDAAAGVMPVYSAFFYEDNMQGALPVAGMHLKHNPLSYSRDVTKFKPWDLPKPIGALQMFIDTGISAEYIMDKNEDDFNVNYLWDTIENAWRERNKAVYYIRTIKKGEKLVKAPETCAGCAGCAG